jgi:hypothetical protein
MGEQAIGHRHWLDWLLAGSLTRRLVGQPLLPSICPPPSADPLSYLLNFFFQFTCFERLVVWLYCLGVFFSYHNSSSAGRVFLRRVPGSFTTFLESARAVQRAAGQPLAISHGSGLSKTKTIKTPKTMPKRLPEASPKHGSKLCPKRGCKKWQNGGHFLCTLYLGRFPCFSMAMG